MNPAPPVTSSLTSVRVGAAAQPRRLSRDSPAMAWKIAKRSDGCAAGSAEVDLAVVTEHEAGGGWALFGAGDLDLTADQGVDETRDVVDPAALEDDRVLDLRAGDVAAVADRGVRPDVAVDDAG